MDQKKHINYYSIKAENNFDLGVKLGEIFGSDLREEILKRKENPSWALLVEKSKLYLEQTKKEFPLYLEELDGYAKSADVEFFDLWPLIVGDELEETDKCTSIVTNEGFLIAHNEDWDYKAKSELSVLKKTINGLTTLELFYSFSLGGSSIAVNSNGYLQAINTLTHNNFQTGVPRNVIARWLSETNNPIKDFERMKKMVRSAGYNHLFVSKFGEVVDIESTASNQMIFEPKAPFIHTNHFLSALKKFETGEKENSLSRFEFATKNTDENMSTEGLKRIVEDKSLGEDLSVFNERTIGKMIVDFQNRVAKIWLLREESAGWIDYPLDFIGG